VARIDRKDSCAGSGEVVLPHFGPGKNQLRFTSTRSTTAWRDGRNGFVTTTAGDDEAKLRFAFADYEAHDLRRGERALRTCTITNTPIRVYGSAGERTLLAEVSPRRNDAVKSEPITEIEWWNGRGAFVIASEVEGSRCATLRHLSGILRRRFAPLTMTTFLRMRY